MFLFSTEVTSSSIKSDNPLYQRTVKAYEIVSSQLYGDVLEIGCGEGYGINRIIDKVNTLTVVDKSKISLKYIAKQYPKVKTLKLKIPPLTELESNSFDCIISFQVIEHIKDVNLFIKEIHRLLKPNGIAFISTPNKIKTLARNPWHFKEFNFSELEDLVKNHFEVYSINGIEGNPKTDQYYLKNSLSVKKFLKFDIFNLEQNLPSGLLKIPYEFANRLNRKKLLKNNNQLVNTITTQDYSLQPYSKNTLDLFCKLTK
ncbi:class I SAM-dependent methyltransferase [Flavobacterium okayamense]|uniref:Methyltransferase type 11 domain-containing protein n=1 Tax=Flavobacterium okayamense TaxID=2830782 RepID=A0ABM7S5J6_9FLAO|nr:class I SAM-dependent methyltransferase [Flavobacterium okayamense]BCY28304.1 hypothetical protein KK2020170_11720 [Flavobacterium okayamense]